VEIDGEDQCELWAVFRVARRARPRDVLWREHPDGFELSAWHDGYERLPARARHAREFRWYDDGVLLVRDRVSARGRCARCRACTSIPTARSRSRGDARADPHPGGAFACRSTARASSRRGVDLLSGVRARSTAQRSRSRAVEPARVRLLHRARRGRCVRRDDCARAHG
jgi:hypothetical protein